MNNLEQKINLDNINIVLFRPKYPENIGSAARAMLNMGIKKLIVVQPENWDQTKVMKLATHKAFIIVDNIKIYDSLEKALEHFRYVVGTTARLGGERPQALKPKNMAKELTAITNKNQTAILFGPEDRGLSNEEIKFCQLLVNIPTAEFSSLNLAQAVLIICYELHLAGSPPKTSFMPRLASSKELEAMYKHLESALIKIDFIHHDTTDHWMLNIRRFFSRLRLKGRDVKIIRGICRQIEWFSNQ